MLLLYTMQNLGKIELPSSSVLYLVSFMMFPYQARVFGKTLVHEFNISYCHTYWIVPSFFARRNSPCFGRCFAYQNIIILYTVEQHATFILFSMFYRAKWASHFVASSHVSHPRLSVSKYKLKLKRKISTDKYSLDKFKGSGLLVPNYF